MDLCWQSDIPVRFVITFLPWSKRLLISWLQSPSAVILESKKIVCHCFHFFPSICHEVMGPDAMILVFWMLSFKLAFSLLSFTFIRSLFISSLLSAIRMVSSAYLRLLISLPEILIPAYASSSLAFNTMNFAKKLNKQGDNIQPDVLLSQFWTMSGSNRCFLTFLQVSQEAGKMVWYPHLIKNFLQFVVIYTEALV